MNYGDQQPQQPPQQQYQQIRMNQQRMMQMPMGQMQQPQYIRTQQPGGGQMYMPMQGGVPMQQMHMQPQQPPQQQPGGGPMYGQQPQQPQMHNPQQRQQFMELIRSFPPEVQQQIQNEPDKNKKLLIVKEWHGKIRAPQPMMGQGPMGMQQRIMAPGQGGGPMYAQPQIPGQPQPMVSGPVPVQRIPSNQGNFSSAGPMPSQGMPTHMMQQPPMTQTGMPSGMMGQHMQQQPLMQPAMPPQMQSQPQPVMVQQHVPQSQPQQPGAAQFAPQQAHTPQQQMQHPSPLMTPQSQSQLSQQPMPTPPQAATPHSQPTLPPSVHSTPGAQASHSSPMPAGYAPVAGGPSSVGPPRSIPSQYAGSPMAATGRPATPSNRSVTSNMSAQQPEIDTTTPEYKAALEKLRLLREPCLKLLEKLKLQKNLKLSNTVQHVYEIMEEKRTVNAKLMLKLEGNLQTLIAQNNVAIPLLNLVKKLKDLPLPADFKLRPSVVRDRWACVRHLEIKPLVDLDDDEEKPLTRKRKREPEDPTEGPSAKKTENAKNGGDETIKTEVEDELLEVACLKGTIHLTVEASNELRSFNFHFDPDFMPISAHSPYVQILVDYDTDGLDLQDSSGSNLVAPLRLLVPREYPKDGTAVQLFQDASDGAVESSDILEQTRTRIDSLNLRTITEVVGAWRQIVAQYTRHEGPGSASTGADMGALSFMEPTRA